MNELEKNEAIWDRLNETLDVLIEYGNYEAAHDILNVMEKVHDDVFELRGAANAKRNK